MARVTVLWAGQEAAASTGHMSHGSRPEWDWGLTQGTERIQLACHGRQRARYLPSSCGHWAVHEAGHAVQCPAFWPLCWPSFLDQSKCYTCEMHSKNCILYELPCIMIQRSTSTAKSYLPSWHDLRKRAFGKKRARMRRKVAKSCQWEKYFRTEIALKLHILIETVRSCLLVSSRKVQ